MTDNNVVMTKTSIRRLQKDIIDIIKNPLTEHGIYYAHDEGNMLHGYAIIFGPSDTIYRYGAYCFKFTFPSDYPFRPPVLTYLTNDGNTRFHPNLYRNGKVCISILNTWKGEQWTSCQTIRSILLMLVTLFHNKPLLNEPGIKESHTAFNPYNNIITYKNIEIAIIRTLNKKGIPTTCECFLPFYKQHIKNNTKLLLEYVKDLKKNNSKVNNIRIGLYSMNCTINYNKIYKDLKENLKNLQLDEN